MSALAKSCDATLLAISGSALRAAASATIIGWPPLISSVCGGSAGARPDSTMVIMRRIEADSCPTTMAGESTSRDESFTSLTPSTAFVIHSCKPLASSTLNLAAPDALLSSTASLAASAEMSDLPLYCIRLVITNSSTVE